MPESVNLSGSHAMRLEAAIRDLKRYLRDVDRAIATLEAAAERELAEKCTPPQSGRIDRGPSLVWDNSHKADRSLSRLGAPNDTQGYQRTGTAA